MSLKSKRGRPDGGEEDKPFLTSLNVKREAFVVFDGEWHSQPDQIRWLLKNGGLLKALSLWESACCGIRVAPTAVLLDLSPSAVERVFADFGCPVMLRMDYGKFPTKKPIGGIPIYSPATALGLSKTLIDSGLTPFFQPHIDRFRDIYSTGSVLQGGSNEITIEILGRGFDAGDLRLGMSNPHERIRYDLASDSVIERKIIAVEEYAISRIERAKRISAFVRYIDDANKNHVLVPSLDPYLAGKLDFAERLEEIPASYRPIDKVDLKVIAASCWNVLHGVIPRLPKSHEYVASQSKIPRDGWTLWDVFGDWYLR